MRTWNGSFWRRLILLVSLFFNHFGAHFLALSYLPRDYEHDHDFTIFSSLF